MSIISLPNQLSNGTVADASQVMANYNAIVNDYNGNITNDNFSSSIAITDNHLNQITTAGKVNGSALISLASIPSGAGVIPLANLPSSLFSPVALGIVSSGTQSITANTWTQRTGWTTVLDSGTYFTTNTYTPLVAGYYNVSYFDTSYFAGSSTTISAIAIYKTGTAMYTTEFLTSSSGTFPINLSVNGIVQCNGSTDTIAFYAFQAGGATLSYGGAGYSGVSITRVF